MKLFIIMSLFAMSSLLFTAQAQDRGGAVPDVVKSSFLTDFPDAQGITWAKRGNYYTVKFVLNGYDQQAFYSGTGTWLHTEITIPVSMMPGEAVEHAKNRHPNGTIINTGYHDEESNRYYRIDMQVGGETVQLKYDDDGNPK
jgi:hypothetical protein